MKFVNGLFGTDIFAIANKRGLNVFKTETIVKKGNNTQFKAFIITDYSNVNDLLKYKLFMGLASQGYFSLLDGGKSANSLINKNSLVKEISIDSNTGSIDWKTLNESGVTYVNSTLIIELRKG